MKRKWFLCLASALLLISACGCDPVSLALIGGAAAGGVGMYAASKDTVQADTDILQEALWDAAVRVCRIRGTIQQENYSQGYLEAIDGSSRIWVRLEKVGQSATRIKVSSRKLRLPNLNLAQEILSKILEEARGATGPVK